MNNTQKACIHVFGGRAGGVHCTRYGLHLTDEMIQPVGDRFVKGGYQTGSDVNGQAAKI